MCGVIQLFTPDQERFAKLARREPRILKVLDDAKAVKRSDGEPFCAQLAFYRYGLKSKISDLVGVHRGNGPKQLRSQEAYDTVYWTVYRALPECRDCHHKEQAAAVQVGDSPYSEIEKLFKNSD